MTDRRTILNNVMLDIARGRVSGTTFIHKFGQAPDFDTTDGFVDIWDGADDSLTNAMTYTFSTTADIDTCSSGNAGDGQVIEIQGLGADFNMVTQTATLNGQSKVPLTTPLMRVFRLINRGSTDNAGKVYCYVNGNITAGVPNTTADIRAIILAGNNQTLMSIYTVPVGKTAYMCSWYASLSKKQASICTIKLQVRPNGEVFQLKHISDIHNTGNNHIQHMFPVPEKFDEKTDIKMQSNTSANTQAVATGFDLILIDN